MFVIQVITPKEQKEVKPSYPLGIIIKSFKNIFKRPDHWHNLHTHDSQNAALDKATDLIKKGAFPAEKVRVVKVFATFEADVSVKYQRRKQNE
ncbi:hypothetical protein [Terribacillus saccharophilus]|uniref:hypothetical protein n=1 Tax=Terribacillus saccharophilus TaxID=361277 RepID=UPI002DCF5684|nr:hypothetical protein [Terribacillus saccharophilus]MEC0288936.1 hypothetical protein [Terribacillus saccharophilus]